MSVAFNTLESLVDRQAVAFIGSVDAEGFPNMKAARTARTGGAEGLLLYDQHLVDAGGAILSQP